MIIGVCGHGASGASALIDMLKEFPEIKFPSVDAEFPIAYEPDGLLDLEYHLVKSPTRYYGCDVAIKRFHDFISKESRKNLHYVRTTHGKFASISEKYIDSLTQLKWRGYWYYDWYLHSTLFNKIVFGLGRRIDHKLHASPEHAISRCRDMYLSVEPENFYDATRTYVRELLGSMGVGHEPIVMLDQPFPYNNPASCFKFFDDPVALVVNRDPRDIYTYVKVYLDESWIPCDSVEQFTRYYRTIRHVDYVDTSNIKTIQYEDLLFNYERMRDEVARFLGFDQTDDSAKKKYFDPEISVGNVQIYKRYPQFADDITAIENELGEYLYDFPKDMGGLDTSKGQVIIYTKSQKDTNA